MNCSGYGVPRDCLHQFTDQYYATIATAALLTDGTSPCGHCHCQLSLLGKVRTSTQLTGAVMTQRYITKTHPAWMTWMAALEKLETQRRETGKACGRWKVLLDVFSSRFFSSAPSSLAFFEDDCRVCTGLGVAGLALTASCGLTNIRKPVVVGVWPGGQYPHSCP